MDCARFESLLFAALDTEIGPEEREWMSRHMQGCADCRRLTTLIEADAEPARSAVPSPTADPDFTAQILLRTSGTPCAQASMQLAEAVDAPGVTDALLGLHLEHCANCGALEGALLELRQDLPLLAEAETDAPLVNAVLAATLGTRASAPAGLWLRLARRPRLALEGSYVIAMLALLAFGLPDGLSQWSASAANALDRSAQSVWDSVLRPRSDRLRALWNEIPSGIVEPDITE